MSFAQVSDCESVSPPPTPDSSASGADDERQDCEEVKSTSGSRSGDAYPAVRDDKTFRPISLAAR